MTDVIKVYDSTVAVEARVVEAIQVGYVAQTVAEGGGAVSSVNGEAGVVVLDAADVGAATTGHTHDTSALALKPYVRSAYITSGDISPLPDTGGVWQSIAGFELSIPAVAGEWIDVSAAFLWSTGAVSSFLDLAVKVGSTLVRHLSSGAASPAIEGEPAFYPAAGSVFMATAITKGFTVTSGDLDGGNVRLVMATKANATGALLASSSYPFWWRAKNLRTPL